MEAECLKPSSRLGDRRSSCHRRALGTAALTVVTPWGPPLLSSPCLGDYRSSCRRRCHALGKKADTITMPGGGRHRVGWRSSPSLPACSLWWNCRHARSCRGSGVEESCSVWRRGRWRSCTQEEGGSHTLTWSPGIVIANLL
jgi:hypothetical protein